MSIAGEGAGDGEHVGGTAVAAGEVDGPSLSEEQVSRCVVRARSFMVALILFSAIGITVGALGLSRDVLTNSVCGRDSTLLI